MKNFKEICWLKENKEKPIEFAIYNDYVKKAFNDFIKLISGNDDWVLIGGIAVGKYIRPRNKFY